MKKDSKEILKVEDYVFEIAGEDIFKTELEYKMSELEVVYFEKGIKKTKIEPLIEFELSGLNKNKKEGWLSFYVKTDIKYLNSIPNNKIVDITNLLWQSEAFVKRPDEDNSDFLTFRYPENNENDMYRLLTSFWVYKLNDNEFVFKLNVPGDVFTYFKIIFK